MKLVRSPKLRVVVILLMMLDIGHWTSDSIYAKSNNEKISFYLSQGDEHLSRGEYSLAIDSYNEAKNIKKKNPSVFLRLGEVYRLSDMKDEAIEAYNMALRYGSNDIQVFIGLGVIYESKYFYEQAMELYKKVLEIKNDSVEALTGIADIYNEQGKYTEAIHFYEKTLFIKSTDEVKLKLAVLNFLVGKNESFATNDYFLKAIACLKKNEISEAQKYLDVIIEQKEDSLSKKLAIALTKKNKK